MPLIKHSSISGSPDDLFVGCTTYIDERKVRITSIGTDHTLGDPEGLLMNQLMMMMMMMMTMTTDRF